MRTPDNVADKPEVVHQEDTVFMSMQTTVSQSKEAIPLTW